MLDIYQTQNNRRADVKFAGIFYCKSIVPMQHMIFVRLGDELTEFNLNVRLWGNPTMTDALTESQ